MIVVNVIYRDSFDAYLKEIELDAKHRFRAN